MRKLSLLMMFVALLFGQACEGPEGPEGAPGPAGPAGPTGPTGPAGQDATATSFLYQIDFAAPNYLDAFAYEDLENFDLEVSLNDLVMVYRARVLGDEANPIISWFALPDTYNLTQGSLIYTYAPLEFGDVPGILIAINSSEAVLNSLTEDQKANFLTEQVFKIVIIPGEMLNGKKALPGVDLKNHDEVIKYFNIDEKKIRTFRSNK